MGSCMTSQTDENKKLNQLLEEQRMKMKDEVTLLFLGPGESGKSTIFKQFKILYGSGFGEHEFQFYIGEIKVNIIIQMKILVEAAAMLNIPLDKKNRKKSKQFEDLIATPAMLTPEFAAVIKDLWADKGIQETYNNRSKFQLNDSTKYFMESIGRIVEKDFQPTQEDILRSRVKTVGVVESQFTIENLNFRMIDVGGQRAERRKWLPFFSEVTSVLFIVGVSEYDQKLREDSNQNRMLESLTLFEQVCNSSYFKTTNFILFFNKTDLFEEKLQTVDLSVLFPTYEGGPDIEKAKNFIINRFREKNSSPHELFFHFTCAIDTEGFRKIFEVVKETLVEDFMRAVQHL
eukprot:TRINITY_DN1619_c0_g1_i1.p1 TRINITY_DN1619_c0_g1~~TRINITY_DN1619_c0_g1_i1.p1  ORF type:complete len:346 (-),score=70.86 TRINITY_DN1619_c0_g1_i1:187-1224(-)